MRRPKCIEVSAKTLDTTLVLCSPVSESVMYVTRLASIAAPPRNSLYNKKLTLTAPADRCAPAAFAFTIRGAAGYLRRPLSPRPFTGRSNGPRSTAPEPSRRIRSHCLKGVLQRTGPALPAYCPGRVLLTWIHRGQVTPSPRGHTYPRLRFVVSSQATLHDSGRSRVASGHPAGWLGTQEVQVILKEPHARGA